MNDRHPSRLRLGRLVACLIVLLLLAGCDDGLYSGSFLFQGTHTFTADEELPGDLFVRAGTAEFASGSRLDGSLYVLGGTVQVNGAVAGDVVGVGGQLALGPEATIGGDLYELGAAVERDGGAKIQGEVVRSTSAALPLAEMGTQRTADDWLRALIGALLLAGLGGLFVRSREPTVRYLGEAAVDHALVSGAVGLLLVLVLPSLLVMMGFTVVLLPLVLIVSLLLLALVLFGVVAVGYQLGSWATGRLGWSWSPAWRAFGGTLLLLALFAIPYVGQGLLVITLVLALGALLLTRAGLRPYTPEAIEAVDAQSYARPGAPGNNEHAGDGGA